MNLEDHFRVWFCGNEAAVDFATRLYLAVHEWDDVEDEGRCESHNAMVTWFAVDKEYHPFFRPNSEILRPALMVMILSWEAANVLDHEPEHIAKAYMLRAAIYQVWHLMAWICGGHDHAAKIGPDVYRAYYETLDQLKEEMGCPSVQF